jgi:ectoine hydroxylase-related dioxygenase (phytanoyl-CoA dioxygenase family)
MSVRTTGDSVIDARAVTDDECAFYDEHGWVKLEGLFSEDAAAMMLAEAERIVGDAHGAEPEAAAQRVFDYFESFRAPSETSELFRAVAYSPGLGCVAARLMSTPLAGLRRARFKSDLVMVKMPEHTGAGRTVWHQDDSYFPFDRGGALGIWVALVAMPPEMGTLRFIEGGHRMGSFGRNLHIAGRDTLEEYPGIAEHCTVSPPLDMRPGDATVHDVTMLHSAGSNSTDHPRWVYHAMYFPSDTLYTGLPYRDHRDYATLPLTVNEEFPDDHFPIVGDF